MSESSLVPERQLVFSPGLAATIGLAEAILLQQLQGLFDHHSPQVQNGHAWLNVERSLLLRILPFWSIEDLQRISRSLVDKGVLLVSSPPLQQSEHLMFAINERVQRTHSEAAVPAPVAATPPTTSSRRSASLLPLHWGPSEDVLQLLGLNHNIPRQFALEQLEGFTFYWRERGETSHAWENKFRQHVISNWRHHQQNQGESFRAPDNSRLDNSWRPSLDAMEIMERGGIAREFIEDAIPEFILYWRERGTTPRELNSKFIQHIRIQWAKYSSSLEHSTEPKRIADNWQPTEDAFDILRLSHIDTEFAQSLLAEFIVYWRDSNQTHTSWNSKFLQHVKYHWAKRHQIEQTRHRHAGQPGSNQTGRTRDRSLQEDLSDTSWAD